MKRLSKEENLKLKKGDSMSRKTFPPQKFWNRREVAGFLPEEIIAENISKLSVEFDSDAGSTKSSRQDRPRKLCTKTLQLAKFLK